jgi:hypothetical protein
MRLLQDGELANANVLNRPHRDFALIKSQHNVKDFVVKPQDLTFSAVNDKLRVESGKLSFNGIEVEVPQIDLTIPNTSQFSFASSGLTSESVVKGSIVSLGEKGSYELIESVETGDGTIFNDNDETAIYGDFLVVSDINANITYPSGTTINGAGKVFVFRYSNLDGKFNLFQEILMPEADAVSAFSNGNFGSAVAIYGDNLIIGATGARSVWNDAVLVYFYKFDGTKFELIQTIQPPSPQLFGNFGYAVSAYEDRIAITQGQGARKIYIYEYNGTDYDFVEQLANIPNDIMFVAGESLAMDSERLFIGAIFSSQYPDGSVHIYKWDGSNYIPDAIIAPSDTTISNFGRSVTVDNNRLLIASRLSSSINRIYHYDWDGASFAEVWYMDKSMSTGLYSNANISLSNGKLALLDGYGPAVKIYEEGPLYAIPKEFLSSGTEITSQNSYFTNLPTRDGILFLECWFEKISNDGDAYYGGFVQAPVQPSVTMSSAFSDYNNLAEGYSFIDAFKANFDSLTEEERLEIAKKSIIINIGTDLYQLRFRFRVEIGTIDTTLEDVNAQGEHDVAQTSVEFEYTADGYKYISANGEIAASEMLRIQL